MAHTHVLSKLSVAKRRDTFIFSHTTPTRLVIGFNHEITTISPADIYRWCTLSDRGSFKTNPDDFYLCPVNLQPYGILRYYLKEAGPIIDPKSTVPFPPGDYGWFHYDGDRSLPSLSTGPRILYTLNELKDVPQYNIDAEKKDLIPREIQLTVAKRDSGKCVLTHASIDVVSTWILRPGAANMAIDYVVPVGEFDEPKWRLYSTADNVVTMTRELAAYFQENTFGVDVGNNRKIVVFDDMDSAASLLPTHFPMNVGSDRFLFEHFRWSMRVHLMHGDIANDYPVHAIVAELDELGHGDDWEMEEEVPFEDPRWRTPVGKDLLRSLTRDKLEAEQAEEGSDSSSSDT